MIKIVLFIVFIIYINICNSKYNNNNNNNNNNINNIINFNNNNCIQTINSISPIHPTEEGSLVLIQSNLCNSSSIGNDEISSVFFVLGEGGLVNCTDIEIVTPLMLDTYSADETFIQCKFGSLPSSFKMDSFNFNQLYSVSFKLNQSIQIDYNSYLFSESKCECNHGNCIYGLCLCDERYAASTCSLKTLKHNDDENPAGVSTNTFQLFLKDDQFQVSTNSFLQLVQNNNNNNNNNNNTNNNNLIVLNRLLINNMTISEDYTTNSYLSFQADKIFSNFISKLNYKASYYQSDILTSFNIQSTNMYSSFGSLLPVSNNSVLVQFTFVSELSTTTTTSLSDNTNIEMVFTVSNKDQDLSAQLSSNKLSLTIYNKQTSSYITISMSDRYSFINSISPNHAYFRILDSQDILSTFNISSTKSIYFSVGLPIPLSSSTTPTTFTSEFIINGFNVEESLSTLKIIIISVAAFISLCIGALIVFIFIRLKNRNFSKSLQPFVPLISNRDVDSDDDFEDEDDFLLRH